MPFSDARDYLEWAFGEKPQPKAPRMTPADFREMREKMGAPRG